MRAIAGTGFGRPGIAVGVNAGKWTNRNKMRSLTHFQRTIHLPVPMLDSKTFLKLLQLDLKVESSGSASGKSAIAN